MISSTSSVGNEVKLGGTSSSHGSTDGKASSKDRMDGRLGDSSTDGTSSSGDRRISSPKSQRHSRDAGGSIF